MKEQTMHIELSEQACLRRLEELRARNDDFRTSLRGGVVVLSPGILALGREAQDRIIAAARTFDDFASDDPWDSHDIGDFEITFRGESRALVFFRIVTASTIAPPPLPALVLFLASEW